MSSASPCRAFPKYGNTYRVRVYGEAVVARFAQRHAASRKPLQRFLEIVQAADWPHFPAVKMTFATADYAPSTGALIFDIGGNKHRVIAIVNFSEQTLLIRNVLTHEEYDREKVQCPRRPMNNC